jgi:hypothetical protein
LPSAEIAGTEYPVQVIDGDTLVVRNYRNPARLGDFLRLRLSASPEASARGPSLVVVIGVKPADAELSCRIEQPTAEELRLLRQLPQSLPEAKPMQRNSLTAPFRLAKIGLSKDMASLSRLSKSPATSIFFASLGGLLGLVMLRSIYTSVTTVTIDNGIVAIPAGPQVAPVDTVVGRERGLIDQLYAREGMAVVPGQPLFSTRHDPQIDLDLLDRSAARDLSSLDAQMRDAQGKLDSLLEQIALNRVEAAALPPNAVQLKTLSQKLQLARLQQQRRAVLLREGGISQDSYEAAMDRVLDLETKQQQATRQNLNDQVRRDRIAVLMGLEQVQRQRFAALAGTRQRIQDGVDGRRAQKNQHPLPSFGAVSTPQLDRDIYKARSAAVVLRHLKRVGEPVQPNETVLLLQREQLPPVVEAHTSASVIPLLALGSQGTAEIPALRQRFAVRVMSVDSRSPNSAHVKFEFVGIQANDTRQILALQGKPVKLSFVSQLNPFERLRLWSTRSIS